MNKGANKAALVLTSSDRVELEYALQFNFKATNNKVKYKALIIGLTIAKEFIAEAVVMHNDLRLVVGQVLGEYKAKEDQMKRYLSKAWVLKDQFKKIKMEQVPNE